MTSAKRLSVAGREVDLGEAGRRLWDSVAGDYELDVHEELPLLEAGRTADLLDRIAVASVGVPLTVTNSRGDLAPHPLLTEARMQSASLAKLLASLRLPSGEEGVRPQRRGGARQPYGLRSTA
jgi:hypothetical protein